MPSPDTRTAKVDLPTFCGWTGVDRHIESYELGRDVEAIKKVRETYFMLAAAGWIGPNGYPFDYGSQCEQVRVYYEAFSYARFLEDLSHCASGSRIDPRVQEVPIFNARCVASQKDQAEQLVRIAAEQDKRRRAALLHDQSVSRLHIVQGMSQSAVKSRLIQDGFKMPWLCGGDWSGGSWLTGCRASRSQRDGSVDNVIVTLVVYRRERIINPDTQTLRTRDIPVDKLIAISYEGNSRGSGQNRQRYFSVTIQPS